MSSTRHLFPFALCLALASTSGIHAQGLNGPASALASGLSLRDPHGAGTFGEKTYLNPPLLNTPIGVAQSMSVGRPDYRVEVLFPNYASYIQIDAHDSGNAIIPHRSPSSLSPDLFSANSWMEVVVSYNGVGLQDPPPMLSGRPTPGGDLIGFFLANSRGIASELIGPVFREGGAASMGLTGTEDVDALDFAIGVHAFAGLNNVQELFENRGAYYFSLSRDCIPVINALADYQFAMGTAGLVAADSATIYRMDWNGTSWDQPVVDISKEALGLDPGSNPNDDVDAIARDPLKNTAIFSTKGLTLGRSQLLFYDPANPVINSATLSNSVAALGNGAGGNATATLGGNDETTDIDAVCIIDPGDEAIAIWPTHYGVPVAVPTLPIRELGSLGLSMTREEDPTTDGVLSEVFHLEFTGLDSFGDGNDNSDGGRFVLVLYQSPYNPGSVNPLIVSAWTPLIILPQEGSLPNVQVSVPTPPTLLGVNFAITGLVIDSEGAVLGNSWVGVLGV